VLLVRDASESIEKNLGLELPMLLAHRADRTPRPTTEDASWPTANDAVSTCPPPTAAPQSLPASGGATPHMVRGESHKPG
jgi:hypothetical protein